MKTAQDIVALIETLGVRLSSLETNQTSNLNLNLGLSNLGLVHQDPRFQTSFSSLLMELQQVYEEYKLRPAQTHWNLQAIYDPVSDATSLIHEILDQLAEDQYSVLDSTVYLSRFAEASEPFQHLVGYNSRDPINISITQAGSYSYPLHGEQTEMQERSSSGLVRINQFIHLLNEINQSFELIRDKLKGDAHEILNNLEVANGIPLIPRGGVREYIQQSEISFHAWSKDRLPIDEIFTKVDRELLCIHRLYLGVNAGDVSWDDILWHFEGMFDVETVRGMTQYFSAEDGIIVSEVGDDLQFLDYLGVGEGLSEVRKLDRAYDAWYSEFHDKKSRIY
jgi:hypothetical protein